MQIKLSVNLKRQNIGMGLFLEKEIELDFLPDVGEEIKDNELGFTVEDRTFYLDGYVSLSLEQVFDIVEDIDEKDVLKRMKESGWDYRGDSNIDRLKL